MYLITFYTNFDASVFIRKSKPYGSAKMKPVPRSLSSSCGTCVAFTPSAADFDIQELLELSFESFYQVEGETYTLLQSKE